MKSIKILSAISLIFIMSFLPAQSLNDYSGTWRGLGYIKNQFGNLSLNIKLILTKSSNSNELDGIMIYSSTDIENPNYGGEFSFQFKSKLEKGILKVMDETVDEEGERGYDRSFQYIDGSQPKLFAEFFNPSWVKDYEIIWLLSKDLNNSENELSLSDFEKCTHQPKEQYLKDNPKVVKSKDYLKLIKQPFRDIDNGCFMKQINLNDVIYEYTEPLDLLSIRINGLEPFYFVTDKQKANAIIQNKNQTKFDFEELSYVPNYSKNTFDIIHAYNTKVTNSGAGFSETNMQKKFQKIGDNPKFRQYILQYKLNATITETVLFEEPEIVQVELSAEALKWFENAKTNLTNEEKNAVVKALGISYPVFDNEYAPSFYDESSGVGVYPLDINGDGVEEIFFSTGMSIMRGNPISEYYLVAKNVKSGTYSRSELLHGHLEFLDSKTNGFNDLVLGGPGFTFPIYKWNGYNYQRSGNVSDDYLRSVNGTYMETLSEKYVESIE